MKTKANEGLPKIVWTIIITSLVLVVLGAILWWYDGYLMHPG